MLGRSEVFWSQELAWFSQKLRRWSAGVMISHTPCPLTSPFLIPFWGKGAMDGTTKPDFQTYYKLTARTKLSKPQTRIRVCMRSETTVNDYSTMNCWKYWAIIPDEKFCLSLRAVWVSRGRLLWQVHCSFLLQNGNSSSIWKIKRNKIKIWISEKNKYINKRKKNTRQTACELSVWLDSLCKKSEESHLNSLSKNMKIKIFHTYVHLNLSNFLFTFISETL